MLSQWLMRLYRTHNHLQFEARIAQRQSLVKQLHERQLDLLITTEAPKMDEFSSQIVGQFSLGALCIRACNDEGRPELFTPGMGA